jgi:type II secretory pathway pseudopilin PulG
MAIVMLIITLLMAGLVPTISSQIEQRQRNETRKQLDEIRDALFGFVLTKGRLPCPASITSNGMESFCINGGTGACGGETLVPQAHGRCTSLAAPLVFDGFVPAATLGITPTDNNGYAVDGWSNRIRYAVSAHNSYSFTIDNGMQITGMGTLDPDLSVCASATGIPVAPATTCGTASILTNHAVAVIYSIGRNEVPPAINIDEVANRNGDQVFVSHSPNTAAAPNGEFDDIVTWISPNILYNRMVTAGKLP